MSVLSLTSRTVLGISSEHGKRNRDTKNHSKNAFHNLIPQRTVSWPAGHTPDYGRNNKRHSATSPGETVSSG